MKRFFPSRGEWFSWISRGISLILQLVIIRILNSRLGAEGFGKYSFMIAIVGMGSLLDFGLSISLQNALASSKAKSGNIIGLYGNGSLIASLIAGCSFLLLGLYAWLFPFPDWLAARGLTHHLFIILVGLSILFGWSNVYMRTAYPENRGEAIYYAQTFVSCSFLFCMLMFGSFDPIKLVVIYYLLMILSNVLVGVIYGGRLHLFKWRLNRGTAKHLISKARGIFLCSIIGLLITQLDLILLGFAGQFISLTYYVLMTKLFFGTCYTMISVFLTLSHSKLTIAWEQRDDHQVRMLIKRLLISNLIITMIFALGFEMTKDLLFKLFLPDLDNNELRQGWIYLFYLYFALRVASDTILLFFMANGKMFCVNTIAMIQALCAIAVQLTLFNHLGTAGLLLGLIVGYIFSLVAYALFFFKYMREEIVYDKPRIE